MSLDELIAQAVEKRLAPLVERMEKALGATPASDELLPTREAVKLVGNVQPATLRRWAREGLLTPFGSSKRRLWKRSELLNLKRTGANGASASAIASKILGRAS